MASWLHMPYPKTLRIWKIRGQSEWKFYLYSASSPFQWQMAECKLHSPLQGKDGSSSLRRQKSLDNNNKYKSAAEK